MDLDMYVKVYFGSGEKNFSHSTNSSSNMQMTSHMCAENIFLVSCIIWECSWSAIEDRKLRLHSIKVIINLISMSVKCREGCSQKVRNANPLSQSELLSETESVVTSQAMVGRVPGMASDQQTFCCQQGGSGLGQGSNGQVTSFFPPACTSAAGRGNQQNGKMSETAL